jgi:hypothetical protein
MSHKTQKPLLIDILPDFADELRLLFNREGLKDLCDQVSRVRVYDKCRCNEDFCSSIYTAPKPKGTRGPGHETIVLVPDTGMINVDIVDRQIVFVEALNRPDIKRKVEESIK